MLCFLLFNVNAVTSGISMDFIPFQSNKCEIIVEKGNTAQTILDLNLRNINGKCTSSDISCWRRSTRVSTIPNDCNSMALLCVCDVFQRESATADSSDLLS